VRLKFINPRKSNRFSRPGGVIYFMFTNAFCKYRDCSVPRLKFITMWGTIHSLTSAYAGSFLLEFAARKGNIFSRPICHADQN
jgi:hypothetical protein